MKRLNLGCGIDYKEGFVNLDFHSHLDIDVQHNLNQFPYPFDDSEFDFIEASHIIEHLDKPFEVMAELHRILKPNGLLHIKVPHFSRGFTHAEHNAGFDVTFPYYFNPNFTKSGYYGINFSLKKVQLNYFAFFHLLPYMGVGRATISIMKLINIVINFFANLNPKACSRIWCFWVGGFEEIEFELVATK
ncbi:MAG: methyltransferase domain-containing protein [Candidatus Obscuribacterales bacterium]|nr:methyltransferase domain-containing protein [Candidatus Obscuribacterales bacterium]